MRRFSGSDRPNWRDRGRIAFAQQMTLYSYRCGAAGHDIEAFYPLGEAPADIQCPDHHAMAVRLPSRGAFAAVPGGHDAEYRAGK